MTENVLVVTIDGSGGMYERGLDAIERLEAGESVDRPARITFADEQQLADVFNEQTYKLLRVVREDEPASIRETARLVGRDVKNVHGELSTLEALGVIRFVEEGRAKRPLFPYDDLIISPLGDSDSDAATVTS